MMFDRKRTLLVVSIVILAIIGLIVVTLQLVRAPQRIMAAATEKKEKTINLSVVVTEVRMLSRLETASMRVVHVSTIEQSVGWVPDSLAGDKLTFFAVGDVIAGIDLSAIREEDVRMGKDGVVEMRLPPPQILVTRIDNQESKILSRSTGALRRSDPHLESRIRAYAERDVRNEAIRKGILPLASRSAETKLAGFLQKLGVERVRFEVSGGGTGG
jgi:hypothetical protein